MNDNYTFDEVCDRIGSLCAEYGQATTHGLPSPQAIRVLDELTKAIPLLRNRILEEEADISGFIRKHQ